jgi:hypothetical protein
MESNQESLEFDFTDYEQDCFYAIRESTLIVYGGYYQSIFKTRKEAENHLKRTEIKYHQELTFYSKSLKFFWQSERRNYYIVNETLKEYLLRNVSEGKMIFDNGKLFWSDDYKEKVDWEDVLFYRNITKEEQFVIEKIRGNQVVLIRSILCNPEFWGGIGDYWDLTYYPEFKISTLQKKEILIQAAKMCYYSLLNKFPNGIKGQIKDLTHYPLLLRNHFRRCYFINYDEVEKVIEFSFLGKYIRKSVYQEVIFREFAELFELLKIPPFKYALEILNSNSKADENGNILKPLNLF